MRIKLNGTVMNNNSAGLYRWFGYKDVCSPDDIRNAIDSCPEDEEIILEVNSGGGSVYAGFEMYSLIRNSGRSIKAEVQSIAGSAMSVIIAACDTVLMSPVANIMIHRASTYSSGNAEDMEQSAQMLNTIDESILNAYCEKVGDKMSRLQIKHMMENETFMTAEAAIANGFADGMITKDNEETDPALAVASINTNLIQMLVRNELPAIEDLQKMKDEMTANNDHPEADETVQDNTEEESGTMEFESVDALREAFPDLCNQIAEDARTAEMERINGIDNVALPGFEQIIASAKADPAQNAGTVAMAIIAEQKKSGANYATAVFSDVEESNVNEVNAVSVDDASEEENVEAEAKKAVALWKGAH